MLHVKKPARAPLKIATVASPKVDKRRLSLAEQNAGCKPLSSFSCLYTLFLKTVSLLSVCSEEVTGIGKGGSAVLLREGAWSLVFYDQFPTSTHSKRTDIFFILGRNRRLERGTTLPIHILLTIKVHRTALRKVLVFKIFVKHCTTLLSKHHYVTVAQRCRIIKMFSMCRRLMRD